MLAATGLTRNEALFKLEELLLDWVEVIIRETGHGQP